MPDAPYWPGTTMTEWVLTPGSAGDEELEIPPSPPIYLSSILTITPDGKYCQCALTITLDEMARNKSQVEELVRAKTESAFCALKDLVENQHTPKVPA